MRISIALSTHNGERFLAEQLQSLAAQTRLPDELVVRDDGSSDGTTGLLEGFARTAPFPVQLEVGDSVLGSTASFETVLARCSGDVVALCDQDDVWRPDKLARVEQVLLAHPEVGLVFSDATLVDEDGRLLPSTLWDLLRHDSAGRWMLRRRAPSPLMTRFAAPGCSIAYRAEHNRLVLPFPPAMRLPQPVMHHDRWVLTLVAAAAEVRPLAECLLSYRLHAGQQIGINPRSSSMRLLRGQLRWTSVVRRAGRPLLRLPGSGRWVVEQPQVVTAAQAVALVEPFLDYWTWRSRLPRRATRRVGPVLRTWRRGDYHRYANGMWSAVADLLRSPAGSRP